MCGDGLLGKGQSCAPPLCTAEAVKGILIVVYKPLPKSSQKPSMTLAAYHCGLRRLWLRPAQIGASLLGICTQR
jgi:hypothetical protein